MTSASDNLVMLVDDMLQDAGLGQDAELRDALVTLGTLASLSAPAPTGELAALLATGSAAKETASDGRPAEEPGDAPSDDQPSDDLPDDELARRRRRHRPTALGLVLVAGMGLGVGGVAASSTAPGNSAIEQLMEDWTPWSKPTGNAAGNPAAEVDADVDSAATASTPALHGAAHQGSTAFRLLQGPAGLAGYTDAPACLGPVMHDAGAGFGKCAAGPAGAAGLAGTGGSKDGSGAAAAAGTPAGPAVAGTDKAGAPAPDAAVGGADPAGAAPAGTAQKAAGSAGAGDAVPGKGQGGSQGNNQKPASPAK
ncbi:hypothetical protein FBY33_1597 [Arthrobacter sp. SLBN-112]|uniref:hypothetical protein n=1 Tax=Arthrobacter sp. SLBN-112 TaxID=2768452 RepID=UPI00114D7171|nr:hypothetical protein [Arthrobacter sp. SLBN-112]TQJ39578.1 hypothetical protein FBY33_1597 [Arthrobacter sp. SLBN-112]